MPFVTQMIRMHRFEEFVTQLVEMHNDEMEDTSMWEVWLHKIFDKSFAEFRDGITGKNTAAPTRSNAMALYKYDFLIFIKMTSSIIKYFSNP